MSLACTEPHIKASSKAKLHCSKVFGSEMMDSSVSGKKEIPEKQSSFSDIQRPHFPLKSDFWPFRVFRRTSEDFGGLRRTSGGDFGGLRRTSEDLGENARNSEKMPEKARKCEKIRKNYV